MVTTQVSKSALYVANHYRESDSYMKYGVYNRLKKPLRYRGEQTSVNIKTILTFLGTDDWCNILIYKKIIIENFGGFMDFAYLCV